MCFILNRFKEALFLHFVSCAAGPSVLQVVRYYCNETNNGGVGVGLGNNLLLVPKHTHVFSIC
jgi:hypothetical protein